jgi:hypothetical protein
MSNQTPNPQDNRTAWIVVSISFLVYAFYFTFILNNIALGIIWFGAAFAFFIIANNPKA